MEALISAIVFSEAAVSGVLVWLFGYTPPKALLVSSALIAAYLLFACSCRAVSVLMARSLGMYRDAEKEEAVRRIMDKYGLWAHAPDDLEIRIIKRDDANACAIWKNVMGINTGLLENATEAEIAGVIGHELGHLHYRDSVYSVCAWGLFAPGVHAFTFVALLVSGAFSLIFGIFLGERLTVALTTLVFTVSAMLSRLCTVFIMLRSRRCEHRADLFSAAIGPEVRDGLLSLLKKDTEAFPGRPGVYMRLYGTHPHPRERIRKIEEVVALES